MSLYRTESVGVLGRVDGKGQFAFVTSKALIVSYHYCDLPSTTVPIYHIIYKGTRHIRYELPIRNIAVRVVPSIK